VKFAIGVAVGWFLFHPINENSKFDQATVKWMRNGGEKAAAYLIKKVDKVVGS
jgi:hypothetical protein